MEESAAKCTAIARLGRRSNSGWDRIRPAPVAARLAPAGSRRPALEDRDAAPTRDQSPPLRCPIRTQASALRLMVAREPAQWRTLPAQLPGRLARFPPSPI